MDVSLIIPMYNEAANIERTLYQVSRVMNFLKYSYEIIIVNDGSKDNTLELLKKAASRNKKIVLCNHLINRGLGNALKTGFNISKGNIIIPLDADLSYNARYISILINKLESNPDCDLVTLSPYMGGGRVLKVPFFRLLISKLGNRVIAYALSAKLHTVTCMVRAYRREVIDSLDLDSEGPEIQMEILAKVLNLGFKVEEIPAVLTARVGGKSKFKLKSGVSRHLLLSLYEKPMLLFGVIGLLTLLAGMSLGIYATVLAFQGKLGTGRALVNLIILLVTSGIIMFFFGFIANQILFVQKELYKIKKQQKNLSLQLKKK